MPQKRERERVPLLAGFEFRRFQMMVGEQMQPGAARLDAQAVNRLILAVQRSVTEFATK